MKIRMLKTTPGSVDGIKVEDYEEGKEYDLSASPGAVDLAKALVGAKLAEVVAEQVPPANVVHEEKALPEPENQAVPAAPENKARGRRKA